MNPPGAGAGPEPVAGRRSAIRSPRTQAGVDPTKSTSKPARQVGKGGSAAAASSARVGRGTADHHRLAGRRRRPGGDPSGSWRGGSTRPPPGRTPPDHRSAATDGRGGLGAGPLRVAAGRRAACSGRSRSARQQPHHPYAPGTELVGDVLGHAGHRGASRWRCRGQARGARRGGEHQPDRAAVALGQGSGGTCQHRTCREAVSKDRRHPRRRWRRPAGGGPPTETSAPSSRPKWSRATAISSLGRLGSAGRRSIRWPLRPTELASGRPPRHRRGRRPTLRPVVDEAARGGEASPREAPVNT